MASCGKFSIEHRHLSHTPGHGHRQSSLRVHISVENIRHSPSPFCSRHPGIKDCLCLLPDFPKIQGSSCKDHRRRILICFCHCLQQLFLYPGNGNIASAGSFSCLERRFSQKENHLVAAGSCFCRLPDQSFCLFPSVLIGHIVAETIEGLPGIQDAAAFFKNCRSAFFFNALTAGYRLLYISEKRPGPQNVFVLCIGTDKGYLFLFFKRKKSFPVLQEHHTVCRRFSGLFSVFLCKNPLPAFFLQSPVGIFEKSQLIFQLQDTEHSLVNKFFLNFSFFHQFF